MGVLHQHHGVVLSIKVTLDQIPGHGRDAMRTAEQHTGKNCPVTTVVEQRAAAIAVGVIKPVAKIFTGTHFPGTLMRGAVTHLPYLSNVAGLRHGDGVIELWPPGNRPVDHQALVGLIGHLQQLVRAGKVGRHGFLDKHMPAAFQRLYSLLGTGTVVAVN